MKRKIIAEAKDQNKYISKKRITVEVETNCLTQKEVSDRVEEIKEHLFKLLSADGYKFSSIKIK